MRWKVLAAAMVASMVVAGAPAGGSQQDVEPLLEVRDDSGDVVIITDAGEQPVPPGEATGHVDIQSVALLEEQDTMLVFEVAVQDLSSASSGGQPYYGVEFSVGSSPLVWSVYTNGLASYYSSPAGGQGGRIRYYADMCVTEPPAFQWTFGDRPQPSGSCYWQDAVSVLDLDAATVRFYVPTLSLVGKAPVRGEAPPGMPNAVTAGTQIHALQGWASQMATPFGYGTEQRYWAQPPDGTPSEDVYPIKRAPPGGAVGASFAQAGGGWFDFVAGAVAPTSYVLGSSVGLHAERTTVLPLTITNYGTAKQIYNLSMAINEAAVPVTVGAPSSIEVPASSSRTVNVVLAPDGNLGHRGKVSGTLEVHSVTQPDVRVEIQLAGTAVRGPGVDRPALFLHRDSEAFSTSVCSDDRQSCHMGGPGWLNALTQDPGAATDGGLVARRIVSSGDGVQWTFEVEMDTPLVDDVWMNSSATARVGVAVWSPRQHSGNLRVELGAVVRSSGCGGSQCWDQVIIGSASNQTTVGPHDVRSMPLRPALVAEAAHLLTAGAGSLFLRVHFVTGETQAYYGTRDGPLLLLNGTSVQLPFVDPPKDEIPVARAFSLEVQGQAQAFVNPGETVRFKVVAVNQANEPRRVEFDWDTEERGWDVDFVPSSRYELGPGESVNVTVAVEAPDDAAEGERAKIILEVDDLRSRDLLARTTLTAIATQGIDVIDNPEHQAPDNDTNRRAINDSRGDSPGLGLVAAALAVASVVALRARPKRD